MFVFGLFAVSWGCVYVVRHCSTDRTRSSCSGVRVAGLPSAVVGAPVSASMLINAVLAFTKAFRLRGDSEGLKHAALERFDAGTLASAKKVLWEACQSDLELAGWAFHTRRGSEKRSQSVAELDDITEAFNALDDADKLPDIYCEANDLLKIPPISVDPVSEQLVCNRRILDSLDQSVMALQENLSNVRSSLSKELATVKGQIAKISASPTPPPHSQPPSDSRVTNQQSSTRARPATDRSSNLILFGVKENPSLTASKELVDEILEYVVGRPVSISDMFRLGRPKQPPHDDSSTHGPRPILIKLASAWDRRLLLNSKRKLKEFRVSRLFLREDLSPEERLKHRKTPVPPPPVSSGSSDSSQEVPTQENSASK